MGIWANDARNGEGVVITLDGIFLAGSFNNDRLVVSIIAMWLTYVIASIY